MLQIEVFKYLFWVFLTCVIICVSSCWFQLDEAKISITGV
ncbi:hypothetical protein F383_32583 [Gossypium arboreum]|uniref:Uncharacterized protein n=1 Tax=Gossypium arboreum TaxID=29729 RepID=A0A0B0MIR2_GOSAR|nr:hypothetical protein F383_38889 [Gossypium arboreum]KHG26042.1 hypothetical protein F383_32583 [Gossypium arboreum]